MISSVLDFDDQVISNKIYIAYAECNIARLKFLTCFSRCAKHLLAFGALINGQSLDDNDTPLHVAARHGLPDHMELYLRHGAALNLQNDEGNTPLNAACSQPQDCASLKRYSRVCHMLVSAGADIHISDADKQTPLHMACKNANPDVVDLLLKYKALVNEMDYGGDAPMHNILKAVAYKTDHEPERIVQALLNYGSIRVWPGALPKVRIGRESFPFKVSLYPYT